MARILSLLGWRAPPAGASPAPSHVQPSSTSPSVVGLSRSRRWATLPHGQHRNAARHAVQPGGAERRGSSGAEPPEFPGCKPVHLPRAAIERFEGRLEYWDAATETAWICEPTTSYHERPARLLTRLAEVIARVRASTSSFA